MDLCVIEGLSEEKEWFGRERDTWHEPFVRPERRFATRTLPVFLSDAVADVDLAARFESLRKAWHHEYGASSSFTKITGCPSYRKIVDDMGKDALPFIFDDLKRRPEPDHWFRALAEITKADPVSPSDYGNRKRIAKAWLKWGRAHGYA